MKTIITNGTTMTIKTDEVIATVSYINDNCFENLNNLEQLLVISNLLLSQSINFLPSELKEDHINLLSNGKRVAYEMANYPNNLGLDLAFKAHLIIQSVNQHQGNY